MQEINENYFGRTFKTETRQPLLNTEDEMANQEIDPYEKYMSSDFKLLPGRPKSNSVDNKVSPYKSAAAAAAAAAAASQEYDRTESGDIED